jgi:hypothetical protein
MHIFCLIDDTNTQLIQAHLKSLHMHSQEPLDLHSVVSGLPVTTTSIKIITLLSIQLTIPSNHVPSVLLAKLTKSAPSTGA